LRTLFRHITCICLGVITPGLGHVYLGRVKHGMWILGIALIAIILAAWSRLVLYLWGLYVLGAIIAIIWLYAVIGILFFGTEDRQRSTLNLIAMIMLFIVIWWGSLVCLVVFKRIVLGFEVFQISSISMVPTLFHGDLIVVDTWAYKVASPTYDDIVLFTVYDKDDYVMVKRIRALSGDTVRFNKQTFLRYSGDKSDSNPTPGRDGETRVEIIENDRFFVVGDNLRASRDSRKFGAIGTENIIGKAVYVLYSSHAEQSAPRRLK
jgi:signal peptidase I